MRMRVQAPALVVYNEPGPGTPGPAGSHSVTVSAGDGIEFDFSVFNNGPGTAYRVVATSALPGDPGLAWTIENSDPVCAIASGALTCSFETIPPGAHREAILHSPTTGASAGTVKNEVVATAANAPPASGCTACSATATSVVQARTCCALSRPGS